MLELLETVGKVVDALDSLRWWRSLLCVLVAFAVSRALDTLGVWREPGALPTIVLIGVIVGVLWEVASAIERWLSRW